MTTIILSALIASLNPRFSRGALHFLKFVRSIKCNSPRKSAHNTLSTAAPRNTFWHHLAPRKTREQDNIRTESEFEEKLNISDLALWNTNSAISRDVQNCCSLKEFRKSSSNLLTPSLAELVAASCLLLAAGTRRSPRGSHITFWQRSVG